MQPKRYIIKWKLYSVADFKVIESRNVCIDTKYPSLYLADSVVHRVGYKIVDWVNDKRNGSEAD